MSRTARRRSSMIRFRMDAASEPAECTVVSPVAVIYNLPEVPEGFKDAVAAAA